MRVGGEKDAALVAHQANQVENTVRMVEGDMWDEAAVNGIVWRGRPRPRARSA